MQFCSDCGSHMVKNTTLEGGIIFKCKCQRLVEGGPDDTLMSEGYMDTNAVVKGYDVFIEQSAHDLAGRKINKECKQCGVPFITQIYVGLNETTMYTCTCGFRATRAEYIKMKAQTEPST